MKRTTRSARTARAALALAAALAAAIPLAGCPTADEPQAVLWRLLPRPLRATSFTTALGYDVELSEGALSIGWLRFHAPAEAVAARVRALPWLAAGLGLLARPGMARAHPGHDMSGDVRGESERPFVVDLTGGFEDSLEGTMYEGEYATASLALQQDSGYSMLGHDHPIVGHTLALVGTADGGDGPIPFELVVDHEETVSSVPFEHELSVLDADGNPRFYDVEFLVDAAEILAYLDFAALDGDGDGAVTAADPDVPNPLIFGLESTLAYSIEITSN